MARVRFGVIGGGGIARRRFLPALAASERAELAAIASRSAPRAAELAAAHGVEPVAGYPALLERSDVDAVYVATPNALHAEWVTAAAAAGKHVLCEKPLATSSAEARAVAGACEAANVALLEGFAYRFHPQHLAARELIDAGEIGEPLLFRGWFGFPPRPDDDIRYRPELGGGALLDAGCYPVHAARRLFGQEPAVAGAVLHRGDRKVDVRGGALLDFGTGRLAEVAFGYEYAYDNACAVWGTEGILRLPRAFSIPADRPPVLVLESNGTTEERTPPAADQFRLEIDAFCAGLGTPATRADWRADAVAQADVLEAIGAASTAD